MQAANTQQPSLQMNDGRSVPITVDQQRDLEMLNLQAQNLALKGELLKRNSEDVQRAINAILAAAIEADKAAQTQPATADVLPFVKKEAAPSDAAPAAVAPVVDGVDPLYHCAAPAAANDAPADPQSA